MAVLLSERLYVSISVARLGNWASYEHIGVRKTAFWRVVKMWASCHYVTEKQKQKHFYILIGLGFEMPKISQA